MLFRSGLLTSDLKYDQMRTVFMVEGAVDTARVDRELGELEATLRGWLHEDGVDDADIRVTRALDCRYVGQGYELRVPLDDGPFTADALARFHELHTREYGKAHGDPIEIVNARVTAQALITECPSLRQAIIGGEAQLCVMRYSPRTRLVTLLEERVEPHAGVV